MRDLSATLRSRRLLAAAVATLVCGPLAATAARADTGAASAQGNGDHALSAVMPSLRPNLVSYYDFEHPVRGNPGQESDRGFSGTTIDLINGGAAMRVRDSVSPGGGHAIQTRQVNPATKGNDDWKAGTYSATGVPTLHAFNAAKEASIMGWFKVTGSNPSLNSQTSNPSDYYNAVGLAGLLSGDSQGHDVRALLEVIDVSGTLRVVALGRRIDGGKSQTFAANQDWQSILTPGTWVFLAASFDYDHGTMRLYKNGRPLDGFYTTAGDPWQIDTPGTHRTTATDPRGIKIGGSFPQNTAEMNPCNCRMDDLMFLNRAVTDKEVWQQYHRTVSGRH
ncbi:LamG-like jellyroll fold domain-containing protein [Actinoallomurus iriomotensis]|uniref:Concanavalin A-like lectin/glucanases superfamily protein n=1 Tax=Actinoallomurus iriomotensis TaxID=478107 RepID=A0A9W6RX22_9ACTN|nr:LamG-like jellyroll fold domain-containing protein [Actinoallomurus iriomotensis]GLY81702.1 hypothetical protein Airi01_099690 [Actinoallomurus iriomotensis]